MKTTLLLLSAALCAVSAVDATTAHVKIHVRAGPRHGRDKIHVAPITHGKLTFLPLGHQCAYDPKNDPSLYPCRDGGVCIRTSPTYGKCFTKEEAAQFQANVTSTDGSDSDDSESASDSGSDSGSGSSSRAGPSVGDDDADGDDGDDDDDAEEASQGGEDDDSEEAEDDSVEIRTKPPMNK